MATIKPTMTTEQINKYLKKYRDITFKKGTYNLSNVLKIYSDTTITCEDGVVFRRCHTLRLMEFVYSAKTTKYNGTHDVKWKGGTFIANITKPGSIGIAMCHAKNIVFDGITFAGCNGAHCIEINSSKDVSILNSTFKDHFPENGKLTKEVIQLDFANLDGFAISNATGNEAFYDGTHCFNILVDNCVFDNCVSGVGTHTISDLEKYHTDISIMNCKFTNMQVAGIKVLGMKDVVISNCEADVIQINKHQTAHKASGGKVKLPEVRYNINVKIDNIVVA